MFFIFLKRLLKRDKNTLQLGQDYFAYTLKKGLPIDISIIFKHVYNSCFQKPVKELFLEQILLSDLILDTYFEVHMYQYQQNCFQFIV